MAFDKYLFDTLYDIKTENDAIKELENICDKITEMHKKYAHIHFLLRRQGVKIPKELPYEII